jgi:hypothetical protein
MVILLGKTGQLCNRLFNLSAFLSHAVSNKYRMTCLGFEEYYSSFEDINGMLKSAQLCINPETGVKSTLMHTCSSVIRRTETFFQPLGVALYERGGDLQSVDYAHAVSDSNLLFVSGWPYWNVQDFMNHSEWLRQVFRPKKEYEDMAVGFIRELSQLYDTFVGVHVRRGDYKDYLNGKFYYADDVYATHTERLYSQLIEKGKKPVFIIFSNELVSLKSERIPVIYSRMSAMSDLAAMARCHYLIGPPSTFSMWASFYGRVPHRWIMSKDQQLNIDAFSPIIAPNTYATGENISAQQI